MNDAHPTPTDAMCNMELRSAVFEILRRHDVSDQCFAEVASVTQAALAQQQPSGEVVGWVYEELRTFTFDEWCSGLSFDKPDEGDMFRNVRPLYAHPPAMEDGWNANMGEAPDGGLILVCGGVWHGEINDAYPEDKGPWIVDASNYHVDGTDAYSAWIENPTHWQHLPQPPKEQG
jgi:hypothetical protein